MAKAEIKTKQTDASVEDFLESLEDEKQREDSFKLLAIFRKLSGEEAKMWGPAIIGFGEKEWVSPKTGRTVDWMLTGFSPRKGNLTLYLMDGFDKRPDEMAALGKYKTGKGCLYIKRLADVDEDVLRAMIHDSIEHVRNT